MHLAEVTQHVLRPDLDGAAAPRVQPRRPAGYDLQRMHRGAGRRQHGQRIRLDVEGIDALAGGRPVTSSP